MQTKFTTIKKGFLQNFTENELFKNFFIKADDVVLYTIFEKQNTNLVISIEIFGWSNDNQQYVPIKYSIFGSDDYSDIKELIEKYSRISKKLLSYFTSFKYYWQFKELFFHLENPTIIYHYKLENTFSKDELQQLTSYFDFSKPILNSAIFEVKNLQYSFNNIFLSHYFNGCYFCTTGIEISVDLDDSDFAVIELDAVGKISKERLFEIIG